MKENSSSSCTVYKHHKHLKPPLLPFFPRLHSSRLQYFLLSEPRATLAAGQRSRRSTSIIEKSKIQQCVVDARPCPPSPDHLQRDNFPIRITGEGQRFFSFLNYPSMKLTLEHYNNQSLSTDDNLCHLLLLFCRSFLTIHRRTKCNFLFRAPSHNQQINDKKDP